MTARALAYQEPYSVPNQSRCEHCGTGLREVNFSEQLDAWVCLGCHFRGTGPTDPETPLDPSSLPTAPLVENGSMGLAPVGPSDVMEPVGSVSPASEPDDGLKPDEFDTATRARALGIETPPGERFACVLPGHDDEARIHPTRTAGRQWRYQCAGASLGLAEVRAALAYGRVRGRLSGLEAALWRARLDHEAGVQRARPVLIVLPPNALEATRRVVLGLQLYLGLRDPAKLGGEQAFTWARPFVMAWCGVTDQQAREATWELVQQGVLKPKYLYDANGELVYDRRGLRRIAKRGRANLYTADVHRAGGAS